MANEAVRLRNAADIVEYTIVNQAIPKGTLMVLATDPKTVTIHSGVEQIPVGIAAAEVKAGDGQVSIGVYKRGRFDMIADGAVTLGYLVVPGSATNDVKAIGGDTVAISQAALRQVIGRCLETAADNEVVEIELSIT